jgi:hypothetical protein
MGRQRTFVGCTKGDGLDLDATSECLRNDHRIIELMKSAFENADFNLTKVG